MTRETLRRICDLAMTTGDSPHAEAALAEIEALARDALGQSHGVWRWRVPRTLDRRLRDALTRRRR